jgi:hypothetical protein
MGNASAAKSKQWTVFMWISSWHHATTGAAAILSLGPTGGLLAGATRRFGLVCTLRDLKAGSSQPPSTDQLQSMFSYFVTIRRVGVTVLAGAIGEIEKVSHVFHPDGRFSAANSP